MSYVPYPRHNESWSSWDYRCREAENDTQRYYAQQRAKSTNWGGYNYRCVCPAGEYRLPDGRTFKSERTFPSDTKLARAIRFAQRNHLVLLRVLHGHENSITSRNDYIAVKPENVPFGVPVVTLKVTLKVDRHGNWEENMRAETYDNDDH